MIRFTVGILITLGAVGAQDYAMVSGVEPPSVSVFLLSAGIGIGLMLMGALQISDQYDHGD